MENMMYVKVRPRARYLYILASNVYGDLGRSPNLPKVMRTTLKFNLNIWQVEKRSQLSYLTFLKDTEESAGGDRGDEVSFAYVPPHTLTVLPTTSPPGRILSQVLRPGRRVGRSMGRMWSQTDLGLVPSPPHFPTV